ncbi:MAG: hypothetical protein ACKN9K_03435, partial [Dolichospermum sp.]
MLVQTLNSVENGDVFFSFGVFIVLRYTHHAVLYQEFGTGVCYSVLVELQYLRVLPEILVTVGLDSAVVEEVHLRVFNTSATVD